MHEYINAIYQHVSNAKTKEEIIIVLPSYNSSDFSMIMTEIIQKLEKEKAELSTLDDEYASSFIKEVEEKIDFCIEYLKNALKSEDEPLDTFQNVIYATSNFGNNLIQADISSISEEYYDDIEGTLYRLQVGYSTSDYRKQKKFTSKQDKDIFEQKQEAIRTFYKRLDDDSVYVFLVMLKRKDWGVKENEQLISRVRTTNLEYEMLKELFQVPEQKVLVVNRNRKVHKGVMAYLSKNKKGGKSVGETKETLPKKEEGSIKTPRKKTPRINKYEGLDPYWVSMYKFALAIYKNRGSINMLTVTKINGVEVGKWLLEQKKAKVRGELSDLQIKFLEQLEIDWSFGEKRQTNKGVKPKRMVVEAPMRECLSSKLDKQTRIAR